MNLKYLAWLSMAHAVQGCAAPAPSNTAEFPVHPRGVPSQFSQQVPNVMEIKKMVPQPTKPVEILGNLGKVLSEGVLLKEQFYTEQNLLHAFGGKQVDWRSREARRLAGEVVDFRDIIPPVRDGTNTFAGMDLLFSRAVEDGNVTATLGMRFRANSGISFEQVEGLFGKNWQTVTRISQHPPAYTPPTKPGGNSRIVYTVPTTGGKAAVEMKFRPDASLAEVDVVTGSGSR